MLVLCGLVGFVWVFIDFGLIMCYLRVWMFCIYFGWLCLLQVLVYCWFVVVHLNCGVYGVEALFICVVLLFSLLVCWVDCDCSGLLLGCLICLLDFRCVWVVTRLVYWFVRFMVLG